MNIISLIQHFEVSLKMLNSGIILKNFTHVGCRWSLTLSLLILSADNICKQLGPRSGPTLCRPDLDLNCLTLLFLKDFFENVHFEKISRTKNHEILLVE